MGLSAEEFQQEMDGAIRSYEKYILCVAKTSEEFLQSLQSLMGKAIAAYENRATGLRHGIALDKHITLILSETDGTRPLCGIYFNLHSPYQKQPVSKKNKGS